MLYNKLIIVNFLLKSTMLGKVILEEAMTYVKKEQFFQNMKRKYNDQQVSYNIILRMCLCDGK